MMLVIHAGETVAAYAARYPEVATWRPERCPRCGAVGQMIGHGCYPRKKPLETTPDPPRPLKIRRWKCTACKRTTSLLPDVLHRYRHYVWAVIGPALLRRYLLGQTWVQIQADLNALPEDTPPAPSLDSLMRWGKAFAGHAPRWLNRVLAVLATVWPQLSQLDAHRVRPTSTPEQLLQAIAWLAGWLSSARIVPAATTLEDLRAAWRWGWNDGLGRLV
jgi:hypothetical protein